MKNIEYISREKKLVAIIIKNNFNKNGINFVTPDRLSLQVGYMKHSQNHIIKPHYHITKKSISR